MKGFSAASTWRFCAGICCFLGWNRSEEEAHNPFFLGEWINLAGVTCWSKFSSHGVHEKKSGEELLPVFFRFFFLEHPPCSVSPPATPVSPSSWSGISGPGGILFYWGRWGEVRCHARVVAGGERGRGCMEITCSRRGGDQIFSVLAFSRPGTGKLTRSGACTRWSGWRWHAIQQRPWMIVCTHLTKLYVMFTF